ncbi:MAG: patatin-like phospholipase family protein [Gemmatimonadota bacterium]
MSETRIALIMGGGVSLGSFSAGALNHVLKLLAHVERGPAKIDVVTGASAGSMTLGVMMYHMFRGSSLDEIEESLRRAWVERITFDALCPDPSDHRTPSLFSDGVVKAIANEELNFDRWEGAGPHPYFAEGAVVSIALTNMNGIAVRAEGQMIRQPTDAGAPDGSSVFADAVQTTFHDDAARFVLRREGPRPEEDGPLRARTLGPWSTEESTAEWRVFRDAAIASGAFPAAFPPVRLRRRRAEFSLWPDELEADEFTFDYVDGGVLRNEPLREAIHLAGQRDEGAEDVERVFIFIDPNVSGTRELYPLGFNQSLTVRQEVDEWGEVVSSRLEEPGYMGRLMGVLGRLVGVLASQAAFRDWLRAARVNSQIEWRDDLLAIVGSLEPQAGSDAEDRVDTLLARIYREKLARGAGDGAERPPDDAVRARIQADLRRRAGDVAAPGFSTKLSLLIDLVANLREKRKVNMVAITPASGTDETPIPIAGNFLQNFGGFFNEVYRTYDFAVGEHLASEVLSTPISNARPFLRPDAPRAERPAHPDPDPSYRGLSLTIQRRFENLVGEHARAFAPIIGLPGALHGVFAGRVRDRVRSALVAEHTGARGSFVLQITGAPDLFLGQAAVGEDVAADDGGRIRTVVAVTTGVDGSRSTQLSGPNVLYDGGRPPSLEVRRRRFLRSSELVTRVTLAGDPDEWLRRARFSAVPVLTIALDGDAEVAVTPEALQGDG